MDERSSRRGTPVLLALLVACAQPATTTEDSGVPASGVCEQRACVDEGAENCVACLEKIGSCCYGDRDWLGPPGTFDLLHARCLGLPGCVACCNECAALSCKQLQRQGFCHFVDDSLVVK